MGDVTKSYPFKLSFKTNPSLFSIEDFVPGVVHRVMVMDSIYNYFPYCELVIMDEASIFTETNYFTEGIDIEMKLSDPTEKFKINHNYYWSEFQMNDPTSQEIIAGAEIFPLKSNFLKQDETKNKSYRGTISSIVSQIMTTYQYPNNIPDFKISSDTNYDIWYQSNEYDYQFIQRMSKYAYSETNINSPFFTFIDSKGKFHFETSTDLMNQKPETILYFGLQDEVTQFNKDVRNDVITEYSVQMLGAPNNMDDYNSTYYKLDSTGTYVEVKIKLSDKLSGGNRFGQNKYSVRRQYLDKVRSIRNFGIVDNFYQQSHYKGWVNNNYIDSLTFPYRIKVNINLNASLCAGKVVETRFRSIDDQKDNKATEYSGNWLILECAHGIDENGEAITSLDLGKSTVNINKKHPFYVDFL